MNTTTNLTRLAARALAATAALVVLGCGSHPDSVTTPSAVDPTATVAADPGGAGPIRSISVTCSGYGCDNKDPIATGCSAGATTVASVPVYRNGTSTQIGSVALRWSSTCGTNWSQLTRTDGACGEYMSASVERSSPYLKVTESLTGYCQIYTDMVYAPTVTARACGLIDESWTSGSACTGWY